MSYEKKQDNDTKIAVLETENNHMNAALLDIKNGISKLDVRFDRIDLYFDRIDRRFHEMEQRLETIESKTDRKLEKLNNKLDTGIDKVCDRLWTIMFWTVGGFTAVLGILAHAMEWI